MHRNLVHQEQLWEISCNLLKDYLSPDIWREYGPSETEQLTGEATASTRRDDPQEPPTGAEQERGELTCSGGGNKEEEASPLEPPGDIEQR